MTAPDSIDIYVTGVIQQCVKMPQSRKFNERLCDHNFKFTSNRKTKNDCWKSQEVKLYWKGFGKVFEIYLILIYICIKQKRYTNGWG